MSARDPSGFEPLEAISALERHNVRYVLIGAIAGRLLGSPTITRDLDICYARDDPNLQALAEALQELHARLRGVGEDVPFILDARTLKNGDTFRFETDAGDLDVVGTPAGTRGYDELIRTAEEQEIGAWKIKVASIDALIQMKRATGRPKDLIEVEVLAALREEIDRGS